MDAATIDGKRSPAALLVIDDICAVLTLSVADALCSAAANNAFDPKAVIEAAKAYKHTAFANRLEKMLDTNVEVTKKLLDAQTRCQQALIHAPTAVRFIDQCGVKAQPVLDTSTSKPIISALGHQRIKSNVAPTIYAMWHLKYAVAHYGRSVCSKLPGDATQKLIASTIMDAFNDKCLKKAATAVLQAYQLAHNLKLPDLDTQPAKRRRTATIK